MKTEKEYKDEIFSLFLEGFGALSSEERRKLAGKLSGVIFKWCVIYKKYYNIEEMGEEIIKLSMRFVKENNNIPKNEKEFFKYLGTSLENAKNESKRNLKSETVDIPNNKLLKYKQMNDIIKLKEYQIKRALTESEKDDLVYEWFHIERGKIISAVNKKYTDALDSEKARNIKSNINPHNELFIQAEAEIYINAIEAVLNTFHPKTRNCYRALFTFYYIKNKEPDDYKELLPALCSETIQEVKEGKLNKQSDVWIKYHPESGEGNAESSASASLKTFLKNLETYLKNKHPEIYH